MLREMILNNKKWYGMIFIQILLFFQTQIKYYRSNKRMFYILIIIMCISLLIFYIFLAFVHLFVYIFLYFILFIYVHV